MAVLAGAEPFTHDGSDAVGVLLCHGFTGTPQSLRPWAEHLAGEGFTVRLPLLPGHGTRWQDMARTGWQDWYSCVESELARLAQYCTTTLVFGLSMGGTLALRLAQCHPDVVAGLVLVNPSVMTLRWDMKFARLLGGVLAPVLRSAPGIGSDIAKPGVGEVGYERVPVRAAASLTRLWTVVRADLPSVTAPLLLYRSMTDHVVEPVNSRVVLDGVRSTEATEIVLADSYHVATLDVDAPRIFEGSVQFARRVHAERVGELAP